MDRNIRSQAVLEYIFVFGFSLIFLTIALFIFSEEVFKINQDSKFEEFKVIADSLKIELATAVTIQNGYNRTFNLPEKINGREYLIYIEDQKNVIIKQENYEFFVNVPLVNGIPLPGKNIIIKKNNELFIN